jgi:serine/threonine-protein kinase RsbW
MSGPAPTDPAPTGEAMLMRAFDFDSLRALRQSVLDCVGTQLGDLQRSEFALAVHEIATNAVRHGGGTGELRLWQSDGHLYCEVVDRGHGIPRGRLSSHRPRPGHIGGWGLWLARQICTTVDIDTGHAGTRIRLRYPLPAPGAAAG